MIGNGSYTGLKPLRNPLNDAADIAAALKGSASRSLRGLDLHHAAMKERSRRFTSAARTADVSLFYYAGHGFQLSARNYLVPVDVALRRIEDVQAKTIELRAMLQSLEGAHGHPPDLPRRLPQQSVRRAARRA